jgi:YebC/PmpR family DNA-binding regulatory protein
MAGHSKWANIKHRKGAQDKRRGKLFTRLIKEVMIAAKEGLPNPDSNPRLRVAIQNAKGANIPKDTIARAVDKGSGKDGTTFLEPTYEGYGPFGIAVFVECATDNINRSVKDVRMVFNKFDGNLGTNGSLSFVFDKMSVFALKKGDLNEDDFTMEMIDANATDVEVDEEYFTVYGTFDAFGEIQKKLDNLGVEVESASIQQIPKETVLLDLESSKKVMRMIDMLEELDDVQQVYHTLELTEELVNEL